MSKTTDSVIVAYDFTNGVDKALLLVGKKNPKQAADVINAFTGKEAEELWLKLTTIKEKT